MTAVRHFILTLLILLIGGAFIWFFMDVPEDELVGAMAVFEHPATNTSPIVVGKSDLGHARIVGEAPQEGMVKIQAPKTPTPSDQAASRLPDVNALIEQAQAVAATPAPPPKDPAAPAVAPRAKPTPPTTEALPEAPKMSLQERLNAIEEEALQRARDAQQQRSVKKAFVPHVPPRFYADRSRWMAELPRMGVTTWHYQVFQISEHAYRVNAFFAFEDGRSFTYSDICLHNYPEASTLVRDWLSRNTSEKDETSPKKNADDDDTTQTRNKHTSKGGWTWVQSIS